MNGATVGKLYAGGCRKHLALLLIVFLLAPLIIVEPLPVTAQEPPLVQFSDVTYSVDENAGSATITVTLSIPPSDTATVDYVTSDGTATAGIGPDYDYIASSGSLTFGAQETSKTFTVTITDDSLDEFDETANLALSNANGAILGNDSTATLTIADNDGPIVAFSSATYDVAENIVLATITVSLSAPSVQTVAVDYASSDESASAGYDYNSTLGTLVFNPGDIIKTFTIPITDDSIDEVNETLHLQLSNADNAVLGDPIAATVTIADNDGPTVAFTAASFSASEGVGFATITVTLNASSPQAVTVDYATSNGTAVAGEGPGYDYVTS
ncbi:MAG: Calx-beta domain-containing protein, partial [Anaerolineae bacterium]